MLGMMAVAPMAAAQTHGSGSIALDVGGKLVGFFTAMTGLETESEVVEHKVNGPDGPVTRKMPGRLKLGVVVLTTAPGTAAVGHAKWRNLVSDGNVTAARANCSITLLSSTGKPTQIINLTACWPSKASWSVTPAGAQMSLSVVYESLRAVQ
jgi:phage tail-like protein